VWLWLFVKAQNFDILSYVICRVESLSHLDEKDMWDFPGLNNMSQVRDQWDFFSSLPRGMYEPRGAPNDRLINSFQSESERWEKRFFFYKEQSCPALKLLLQLLLPFTSILLHFTCFFQTFNSPSLLSFHSQTHTSNTVCKCLVAEW